MTDKKQIVTKFEDAIKRLNTLEDILFYVTTIDERRSTLKDTLLMIQQQIFTLDDGTIYSLYEQVLKGHDTFIPRYEQILQADYYAFIKRLSELWTESSVALNEADIELKEHLGLDASYGIWGPKGWSPPISA